MLYICICAKITFQLRYFIELSYKGTNYHGWQYQPNAITIQELLNKALSTIFRTTIDVVGAGRTDRGVHALSQFANFKSKLIDLDGGFFGPSLDEVNETFETKWKKFLIKESEVAKVMSQAMFKLQDEPKEMLDAYKASLTNDIRLNGQERYADYSVEDFIEDYENYIADKMDY